MQRTKKFNEFALNESSFDVKWEDDKTTESAVISRLKKYKFHAVPKPVDITIESIKAEVTEGEEDYEYTIVLSNGHTIMAQGHKPTGSKKPEYDTLIIFTGKNLTKPAANFNTNNLSGYFKGKPCIEWGLDVYEDWFNNLFGGVNESKKSNSYSSLNESNDWGKLIPFKDVKPEMIAMDYGDKPWVVIAKETGNNFNRIKRYDTGTVEEYLDELDYDELVSIELIACKNNSETVVWIYGDEGAACYK